VPSPTSLSKQLSPDIKPRTNAKTLLDRRNTQQWRPKAHNSAKISNNLENSQSKIDPSIAIKVSKQDLASTEVHSSTDLSQVNKKIEYDNPNTNQNANTNTVDPRYICHNGFGKYRG